MPFASVNRHDLYFEDSGGNRPAVIFSHGFLLDQQAREAGVFDVVDTLDFLPTSPRDSWTHCPE